MKKLAWNYGVLLIIAGAVIALDQWTKSLLRSRLGMGETWPADSWILGLFKLAHTQNSGAAFSMGSGLGPVFTILAIGVAIAILVYYPRLPSGQPVLRVLVGLMLGGALGNLIDRLTIGQVTDFIMIRFFAIVNVADICLTTSCVGLILWFMIEEEREKKRSAESK